MNKTLDNTMRASICAVLTLQLIGCGTILYPERKGQKSGHVDVGVALLDGIGLFFFLIPGIIAYAVDFSNGTIYLPGTSMSTIDMQNIKQVKFDPKHSTIASIEKLITEETGYVVKLEQPNTKITQLRSTKEMMMQFALNLPGLNNDRLALTQ